MDDTYGVNVQFEDSDEEDDDANVLMEDDEEEGDAGDEGGVEAMQDGTLRTQGVKADAEDGDEKGAALHARHIDAYWLQRSLNKFIEDPVLAQRKAKDIIDILQVCSFPTPLTLQNAGDDRECENQLVLSLGFDQFDFIRTLREYRHMILYCTLLAQAQTPAERAVIEKKMTELGEVTRKILKELREIDEKDIVETEREKRDRLKAAKREAEATSADSAAGWFTSVGRKFVF